MGLFRFAAVGAAGYALYRYITDRQAHDAPVAFAHGEIDNDNFSQVRSAGVEGMRSNPPEWDATDQAMDESFPASDPPANY